MPSKGLPMPRYSHRNGETEPPAIIGEYWFRGRSRDESSIARKVVVAIGGHVYTGQTWTHAQDFFGEWWGPLDNIPPWEDAPAPQANEAAILRDFYKRVCERAERNMELTGTVSGAHWNAMQVELKARGIK